MGDSFAFQSRPDIFYGMQLVGRLAKPNVWRTCLNMRFHQTLVSLMPRKVVGQTIAATSIEPPSLFCISGSPVVTFPYCSDAFVGYPLGVAISGNLGTSAGVTWSAWRLSSATVVAGPVLRAYVASHGTRDFLFNTPPTLNTAIIFRGVRYLDKTGLYASTTLSVYDTASDKDFIFKLLPTDHVLAGPSAVLTDTGVFGTTGPLDYAITISPTTANFYIGASLNIRSLGTPVHTMAIGTFLYPPKVISFQANKEATTSGLEVYDIS